MESHPQLTTAGIQALGDHLRKYGLQAPCILPTPRGRDLLEVYQDLSPLARKAWMLGISCADQELLLEAFWVDAAERGML